MYLSATIHKITVGEYLGRCCFFREYISRSVFCVVRIIHVISGNRPWDEPILLNDLLN